ncbi:zinc finger protein 160-like, partial [Ostrinia furnacalis]|uniref:zinc finger protein 160-like n=1 Tax=Ostrinia furnacalis TaxID=93504 RepID=UPI00103866F4
EGFYKDTGNWYICWECWAVMTRICRFRSQACAAQRQLADIVDGRVDLKFFNICLSRLSTVHKTSYDDTILTDSDHELLENFIDCGPDIKTESDEDIPLSEFNNTSLLDDREYSDTGSQEKTVQPVYKKRKKNPDSSKKKSNKNSCKVDSDKICFITTEMSIEEMLESREKRKMALCANAPYKCESCIEVYKSQIDLDKHFSEFHTEKGTHTRCDICMSYMPTTALPAHRNAHYLKYTCVLCDITAYSSLDMVDHLKSIHSVNATVVKKNKDEKARVPNPGSKPRRKAAMMDKRTPLGYQCAECDKYFENKNQRWKHVQRSHREGYKCSVCSKRFAFKNNLTRHEQMHKGPPPRQECPQCHKQVRVDLIKVHARIHTARQGFVCVECDKRFASRASYEHHLKYTQVHAPQLLLKYKCATCDKGYRSRGELRDHVNYKHMGRTQHKCPICGKALATRRCVGRHVRRAHEGVRESARDKVCQQCGKTFRDKKGLREHEFIHTGERPLACEICGCTFRQSASLYTHRKRVHKIFPQKKNVELLEPEKCS